MLGVAYILLRQLLVSDKDSREADLDNGSREMTFVLDLYHQNDGDVVVGHDGNKTQVKVFCIAQKAARLVYRNPTRAG
jgi:hypothetical protein